MASEAARRSTRLKNVELQKRERRSSIRRTLFPKMKREIDNEVPTNSSENVTPRRSPRLRNVEFGKRLRRSYIRNSLQSKTQSNITDGVPTTSYEMFDDLIPRRSTRLRNIEVQKCQRRSYIKKILSSKTQSETQDRVPTNNYEAVSIDELGCYWSLQDIKTFFATYEMHPKDWTSIAEALNRSKQSVIAFYDNFWVDCFTEQQVESIHERVNELYGRSAS